MTLAGLEDALQEQGIETFDISDIEDRNTREKIEQKRRRAFNLFILYTERNGIFEHYATIIGEDVRNAIQENAFNQNRKSNNFGEAYRILKTAYLDSSISQQKIIHLFENPANQGDMEYFKKLILDIEEALPYNPIRGLEQKYSLKLKPVVTREEKKNGMVPAGLVVTYHLAE